MADEIMPTAAEEIALAEIVDGVRKPKRRQPTPAAEMPPVNKPEPVDLNRLVIETDADLRVLSDPVRHQAALREFARELWEEAYCKGADDVASCCGCTGKSTPNPFEEPDNG